MNTSAQAALHAERFRQMVESAPNAMILVDSGGKLAYLNQQTETLFGYPREQLLGQAIEVLLPPRQRPGHPALREGYFAAPEARSMGGNRELYGETRDGRRVPVEIGLTPIDTAEGRYVLASIIDISERRRADEALRAQMLETGLALDRLRETQKQLIYAEKMAALGSLVAGVAHEINTPLGIGVTATSHLADEVEQVVALAAANRLTRAQFQSFLSLSQQSASITLSNLRLAAGLIQSFKRVAVDQSTEERRRINLKQYLDEILLSLRPSLKLAPQRVLLDCPDDIELDTVPGAWAQIISNLVLNAYTHAFSEAQAGSVWITVERRTQRLKVSVRDDGAGIAKEVLPRIFDPFFTTRRGQGGTGLGLNIVFNLVCQTLGGSIEASSEPGKGTVFTLQLPHK